MLTHGLRSVLLPGVAMCALAALGFTFGCGSARESGFDDGSKTTDTSGTGTDSPPGSTGSTGSFGAADAGEADDAGAVDGECPKEATLVYVTGQGSKLYSFDPQTLDFDLIGTFSCLTTPTHMTIDRHGAAWVVANGNIYKASTKDASCAPVPTWKSVMSFADFALTFVGTTDSDDTLYLMNGSGKLGSWNTTTGTFKNIKSTNVTYIGGDMTSSGDGFLYFADDTTNHTLYRMDPGSGSVLDQTATAPVGMGTQALAFWGGTFYVFVNSAIYAHDPVKKTTKAIGTAPLNVTGAGQSTCVPKVAPPPK